MHCRSRRKRSAEMSLSDSIDTDTDGNSLSLIDVISVDDNMLEELDTREAVLDGRLLDLTAREFELHHAFLAAPGRVFTREMLLAKLWGYDFYGDERVVDSHIKNLRHKLGRNYIDTVRGVGYRAAKEDR